MYCVHLAAELKAEQVEQAEEAEQAEKTDELRTYARATFEMVAVPEECEDELRAAGVDRH